MAFGFGIGGCVRCWLPSVEERREVVDYDDDTSSINSSSLSSYIVASRDHNENMGGELHVEHDITHYIILYSTYTTLYFIYACINKFCLKKNSNCAALFLFVFLLFFTFLLLLL